MCRNRQMSGNVLASPGEPTFRKIRISGAAKGCSCKGAEELFTLAGFDGAPESDTSPARRRRPGPAAARVLDVLKAEGAGLRPRTRSAGFWPQGGERVRADSRSVSNAQWCGLERVSNSFFLRSCDRASAPVSCPVLCEELVVKRCTKVVPVC